MDGAAVRCTCIGVGAGTSDEGDVCVLHVHGNGQLRIQFSLLIANHIAGITTT
jgi:hypothetical protein